MLAELIAEWRDQAERGASGFLRSLERFPELVDETWKLVVSIPAGWLFSWSWLSRW